MIAVVLGTRAELIKIFPIMKELDKREIPWTFIHTGQHKIDDLIKELKIKQPDVKLDISEYKTGKFKGNLFKSILDASVWSLKICLKLRKVFQKIKPDFVVCQGDTLATAVAVIADRSIVFKRPKIGHVEAGLRSYDLFEPFPEEISRRISDKFSDFLFAPTKDAIKNLKNEFRLGKIYYTGNTIVDAVNYFIPQKIKTRSRTKYVIAQIHRQENINSYERMKKFVDIITKLPYKVILIVHGNTEYKLKEMNLWNTLRKSNIKIMKLRGYASFLKLLNSSTGIITDSGGVQEECCILKKPCLVFRQKTERPEAIRAGVATLMIDKDVDDVVSFLKKDFRKVKNPFGDGKAAERIVDYLESGLE